MGNSPPEEFADVMVARWFASRRLWPIGARRSLRAGSGGVNATQMLTEGLHNLLRLYKALGTVPVTL